MREWRIKSEGSENLPQSSFYGLFDNIDFTGEKVYKNKFFEEAG